MSPVEMLHRGHRRQIYRHFQIVLHINSEN